MTRISPILVATALAFASPAFAGSVTLPLMPTLTFPEEQSTVTKSTSTLLETCVQSTQDDACSVPMGKVAK